MGRLNIRLKRLKFVNDCLLALCEDFLFGLLVVTVIK